MKHCGARGRGDGGKSSQLACDLCSVRIPKAYSNLVCHICNKTKHMKCQKLSRKEADQIISSGDLWICYECIRSILPINACENSKIRNRANLENYSEKSKKFKLQCTACLGYCYHETSVRTCSICHKKVHKKCHKENLGCIACCESLIPGYHHCTLNFLDFSE